MFLRWMSRKFDANIEFSKWDWRVLVVFMRFLWLYGHSFRIGTFRQRDQFQNSAPDDRAAAGQFAASSVRVQVADQSVRRSLERWTPARDVKSDGRPRYRTRFHVGANR